MHKNILKWNFIALWAQNVHDLCLTVLLRGIFNFDDSRQVKYCLELLL